MGCVCDKGYEGYDCSFRSCPKGVDPTSTSIVADEKFTIHCRAQSGSFVIQAFGKRSAEINRHNILCVHMYTYRYLHTYMYIYIHIHTYTYIGNIPLYIILYQDMLLLPYHIMPVQV